MTDMKFKRIENIDDNSNRKINHRYYIGITHENNLKFCSNIKIYYIKYIVCLYYNNLSIRIGSYRHKEMISSECVFNFTKIVKYLKQNNNYHIR